MIAVQTTG